MIPTITEQQKQQFAETGFFVLDNVFTREEMNELAASIEGYERRHEEALAASGSDDGISRAGEISFTGHLAENDPAIRAFATRPEFVAITTQLLGPDIDLFWNQSVFKQPEGQKEFPWHQDDAYAPVTPTPYLTLWLALNDATPENGCISVIPKSHTQGLVPHWPSPLGLICYDSEAEDQGVQIPVKAGSIAAFPSLLFHKSGVNRSSGTRKAYILQYSHAGLIKIETGELIPDLIPVARNGKAS